MLPGLYCIRLSSKDFFKSLYETHLWSTAFLCPFPVALMLVEVFSFGFLWSHESLGTITNAFSIAYHMYGLCYIKRGVSLA